MMEACFDHGYSLEHYHLGETKIIENDPFQDVILHENVIRMKVFPHSPMKKLLGYAIHALKKEDVQQILWLADGDCVDKATNCADIVKRKVKNVYTLSRKGNRRIEEYWVPTQLLSLDRLRINRVYGTISILQSKISLEQFACESGYAGASYPPPVRATVSQIKQVTKKEGTGSPETIAAAKDNVAKHAHFSENNSQ